MMWFHRLFRRRYWPLRRSRCMMRRRNKPLLSAALRVLNRFDAVGDIR
jgi:hypothetical protein